MRAKQPVSVAGIEFDAIIEATESYSASVPSYPIDNGYSVSDNAALEAMTLSMKLYVTATPVTWLKRHGTGEHRIRTICDELIELYVSRQLIEIATPEKVFSNMVINNITIKATEEQGYAREIPVSFTQVTVTTAGTATVPAEYMRSGETMQSVGAAGVVGSGATATLVDRHAHDNHVFSDGGDASTASMRADLAKIRSFPSGSSTSVAVKPAQTQKVQRMSSLYTNENPTAPYEAGSRRDRQNQKKPKREKYSK